MADLDLTKILDDVLDNTDIESIENVSAEGSGNFQELPTGHYLCELEDAKLTTSKSSGKLMASFTYKTIEDGVGLDDDGNLIELAKTKGRKLFKHFVLQNDDPSKQKQAIDDLISDIKKFEAEPGIPLVLDLLNELKEKNITKSEFITSSLEFIKGLNIWVSNTVGKNKNGESTSWVRAVSWDRARKLGLEEE